MNDTSPEQPDLKIHVDSDWKDQARKEKERLAEIEAEKNAEGDADGAAGQQGLPPANWETLISLFISQALLYLGGAVDPKTNRVMVDLDAGRHYIDLLGVLEEKTKGNLSDEEAKQFSTVLYELRMQYTRISQAAASSVAGQPQTPGTDPSAGQPPLDLGQIKSP